jgi:hypothetical protein
LADLGTVLSLSLIDRRRLDLALPGALEQPEVLQRAADGGKGRAA